MWIVDAATDQQFALSRHKAGVNMANGTQNFFKVEVLENSAVPLPGHVREVKSRGAIRDV